MQLKMVKGQEHGLVISDKITDPNEFMYPAYRQALNALREIIQQPKQQPLEATLEAMGVYGYLHNIITFSGSRGQGKTSTMVSFSRAMGSGFKEEALERDDVLKRCRFTVLPPIDPTILEQDQSILAVILSRMYRKAEQFWEDSRREKGFSAGYGRGEAEKNELLKLFQQCLSGINAIKFRSGGEIRSLSGIHEISDSAILKDNFQQLTQKLLHFTGSGDDTADAYLVVQLDDTDFQIRKGYELLEDIRKYLTIPNMIILMATDMDMLRITLTQHYVQEFEKGLKEKIVDVDQLRKLESKYLDKLIPPNYTVYLPHLDDVLHQQGDALSIQYFQSNKEGANDFLGAGGQEEAYSFQSLILRYVYRKTRIVFAEPASYMHNLIPTTLRGFAQFLGMLSSMEDVPVIIEGESGAQNMSDVGDPQKLARLVDEQLKVLEVNLPRFEHYFLNDWVHTKLSVRKAAMLEKLGMASLEERCQLVVEQLWELYNLPAGDKPSPEKAAGYGEMVAQIQKLRKTHRQMEDFYFFFAIHTFFTIQSHKEILRQKRAAIAPHLKGVIPGPIIFDFSPELTYLPTQYSLPDDTLTIGGQKLAAVLEQKDYNWLERRIGKEKILRYLVTETGSKQYRFSFMNFITLFLSKDALEEAGLGRDESIQAALYTIQTSAATVAINWDVQDALQKKLGHMPIQGDLTFLSALRSALTEFDNEIQGINARWETAKPMICSWLKDIVALATGLERRHQIILGSALNAIEEVVNKDHLNNLRRIYAVAQQLDEAIWEEPVKAEKLGILWRSFINESRDYNAPQQEDGFDWSRVQIEDLIRDLVSGELVEERGIFRKEFDRQMGRLCKHFGYRMSDVKKKSWAEGGA